MSRPALLVLSVLLLAPGPLADLGAQVECSVAAVQAKSPPGTTITAAAVVTAADKRPAYCRVDGCVAVPGNEVNFRLGLPDGWNGKLLFQGVGGLGGTIANLDGSLTRGYAAASTDTGHVAGDPTWGANRAKEIAGISAAGTVAYYDQMAKAVGGPNDADSFTRLYMVPGRHRCGGGPGPNAFDMLPVLEAWVEKSVAPGRVIASRIVDGKTERTRPLCPHPQVARHSGSGNIGDAASFRCEAR